MDPDLKLRVDWDEARAAFVEAKKTRDKDPDGYAKAKKKMQDMRTYWRQIREALGEGAVAATISAKVSN